MARTTEVVTSLPDQGSGIMYQPPRPTGAPIAEALGDVAMMGAKVAGEFGVRKGRQDALDKRAADQQTVNQFFSQTVKNLQDATEKWLDDPDKFGWSAEEFRTRMDLKMMADAAEFSSNMPSLNGPAFSQAVLENTNKVMAGMKTEYRVIDGTTFAQEPGGELQRALTPQQEADLSFKQYGGLHGARLKAQLTELNAKGPLTSEESNRKANLELQMSELMTTISEMEQLDFKRKRLDFDAKNNEVLAQEYQLQDYQNKANKEAKRKFVTSDVLPLVRDTLLASTRAEIETARTTGNPISPTFTSELTDQAMQLIIEHSDAMAEAGYNPDTAINTFQPVVDSYVRWAEAAAKEDTEVITREVALLQATAERNQERWRASLPLDVQVNLSFADEVKGFDANSVVLLEPLLGMQGADTNSMYSRMTTLNNLAINAGITLRSQPEIETAYSDATYKDENGKLQIDQEKWAPLAQQFHDTTNVILRDKVGAPGDLLSGDAWIWMAENLMLPYYKSKAVTKKGVFSDTVVQDPMVDRIQRALDKRPRD